MNLCGVFPHFTWKYWYDRSAPGMVVINLKRGMCQKMWLYELKKGGCVRKCYYLSLIKGDVLENVITCQLFFRPGVLSLFLCAVMSLLLTRCIVHDLSSWLSEWWKTALIVAVVYWLGFNCFILYLFQVQPVSTSI